MFRVEQKRHWKIETVCDFFMSVKCNDNTIPKQVDNDNQKIKLINVKSCQKQCLTCNNIVPKQIYLKKHILFNENMHCL